MEVWDAIRKKRAVRQFKDTPLKDEDIHRILDAGRRSQSWTNDQLWNFIAIRDRETLQKLSAAGNYLKHVKEAALVVVMLIPSDHERTNYNYFDLGQSASYMQLAAQELGIGSGLGTINQPDLVRELLHYPPDWQAVILLAFGYPLEEKGPAKKGGRRSFDDVVHWEVW